MRGFPYIPTAFALITTLAVSGAEAAYFTYSDRNAFTAAASGLTNIDFEAQNTDQNGFTNYNLGLNVGGVSFSAPNTTYLYVADDGVVNPAFQWNSGASLLFGSVQESNANLVISFGTGVFAVGFDLMAQADSNPDGTAGFDFAIEIGNSTFTAQTLTRPNRAFFGVTSETAITSMALRGSNPFSFRALPIIDNVTYGGVAQAVPEPGSLALTGLALAMAGVVAARRQRR
jgi:hypothetical protein